MTDTKTIEWASIADMNFAIGWFDKVYERTRPVLRGTMTDETWCHYLADMGYLKYHYDWNAIHQVAIKVEQELSHFIEPTKHKRDTINEMKDLREQLSAAISSHNLSEAHRILYSAVEWINKQKK